MGPEETLWRRRVCAILRRGGIRHNDLEDLCQEVAVAYFQIRGLAPWDDTSPQPHLLAHLVKSVLSGHYVRLRRCSELLERYACHIALARTPDNVAQEHEVINKLHELPPELQEIIGMKVLEGYTFSEISTRTSCPEGTIKTRYYRGIAILREALKDTTISAPQGIKNMETKTKGVRNSHASEGLGQDGVTADGRWGGVIPMLAGTAIYRHEAHPEGCSSASKVSATGDPFVWARNVFLPARLILTCPPGGSDFRTSNEWCQRVLNADCDSWTGSRADYLRQRNKCWWEQQNGYYLVTCGQWQPWDCCHEQEATPEPPCPLNRFQIYCTPVAPQQCP